MFFFVGFFRVFFGCFEVDEMKKLTLPLRCDLRFSFQKKYTSNRVRHVLVKRSDATVEEADKGAGNEKRKGEDLRPAAVAEREKGGKNRIMKFSYLATPSELKRAPAAAMPFIYL